MDKNSLKRVIEALLCASEKPLSISKLQDITEKPGTQEIREAINELKQEYETAGHAFGIQEIAGGYQILTRPEYHSWVTKLKASRSENKLSGAALETLSIIAYKQPVLKAEIESIRGVDCGAIIRGLMEKGLVRIAGRAETLGRPIIYSTTNKFLELLGLPSIKDLPKPEELR